MNEICEKGWKHEEIRTLMNHGMPCDFLGIWLAKIRTEFNKLKLTFSNFYFFP